MYNAVIRQLTGESTTLATVPALKKVFDLFVAKVAALLEFGVTGETLESFAEAIDDFSETAALPRNKISSRSTNVKNRSVLFSEADKLLNEQIKNTMVALKKKYPDVYTTFINNSKIVDAPSALAKTGAANKAARAKKKDIAVPQL